MEPAKVSLLISVISAIFTGLGVLVAVLAKMESRGVAKENQRLVAKANEIQEQLIEIEQERNRYRQAASHQAMFNAQISARLNESKLIIYLKNIGNGNAHKAHFFINRVDIVNFPTFKTTSLKAFEPTLEVGSVTTFEFHLADYSLKPETMFVRWENDLGEVKTQHLEL